MCWIMCGVMIIVMKKSNDCVKQFINGSLGMALQCIIDDGCEQRNDGMSHHVMLKTALKSVYKNRSQMWSDIRKNRNNMQI